MQAPTADFTASPELEKLFDKLIKAVEGLKGSFSSGINVQFPTLNFKDMFKNPFKGLSDRISKKFDKFGDVLKAPFKKLGDGFGNLSNRISAQFGKFGDVLKAPFKKLGDGLGKMFGFRKKSPEEKMADMSSKTYRLLFRVFRPLLKNIRDDLRALTRGGGAGGSGGAGGFGSRAKNALTGIGKGLGKAMESILKGFSVGLTKMGNPKVLRGILNLGLLGVALVPFAFALKLFNSVRFDKVLIGVAALGAIAAIAFAVGGQAPIIGAGAIAIGALGLALIPFGFGLGLVADASQRLIPFLESLTETFKVGLEPVVLTITEGFKTMRSVIQTVENIVISFGGIIESSFSSTKDLIEYLATTDLTGTKLIGLAGGIVALAGSLLLLTGANVVGAAIEGIKTVIGDAYSGFLSLFGAETSGESGGPIEMIKGLATLANNAPFLKELPTILDRLAESFSNLFDRKFDINNFMNAIGALTSQTISFRDAIEPFTTAAVGETAVGLATGAEAAGGAAMAPVINNVVTNSSAPTQIVPDSNIGSRSTDRDVFSPLDNSSPFKFAGL